MRPLAHTNNYIYVKWNREKRLTINNRVFRIRKNSINNFTLFVMVQLLDLENEEELKKKLLFNKYLGPLQQLKLKFFGYILRLKPETIYSPNK